MLFIEGSRSIYDMRFQSWPATKWLLKIKNTPTESWTGSDEGFLNFAWRPHVDLMALCISLYQVMCPYVLRCQYRQMYTSKKKNILTVNNSYINSLLFLLFKTNYFRFHTGHHWASSAGPSASTGAGAEGSSGGAWHHCIKMGKRRKGIGWRWIGNISRILGFSTQVSILIKVHL